LANKEILIANLRKQLSAIEKVYRSLDEVQNEIKDLICELEDESKLGSPGLYDFGSKRSQTIKKKLFSNIKKDIKSLEYIADAIQDTQKETSMKIPPGMEKFDEE